MVQFYSLKPAVIIFDATAVFTGENDSQSNFRKIFVYTISNEMRNKIFE